MIFAANEPMQEHPDNIVSGTVLRIQKSLTRINYDQDGLGADGAVPGVA
jgi:hypothetical protein